MGDPDLLPSAFLDLDRSAAAGIFRGLSYPWEAIPRIAAFVADFLRDPPPGYRLIAPGVLAAEGSIVSPRAELSGPAIIGPGSEVRTGAFLRENVVVGARCVVGNSSELKNCVLFDGAQAPHFNYVGDSIMGALSHIGAGVVLSNFKSDKSEVLIRLGDGASIRTGLRKLGAVIGDRAEIGCNSVCFPGTLVGRDSTVYPLCPVRGVVPALSVVKGEGLIVPKRAAP
jgi:UDP-N-acetylglucosamine diphosphorylase / glucose-1-phosphate thymidylyltransferase / UDP-N-acetylgalactosamine diphosphorylase / glucosamine-1-phosphate N-acetyltransferase / galactosamine-1-phosphate N-acetyltransferase